MPTKFDRTFIQTRPQPITLPPDAQIEQQIPQRPASVHADVLVPLVQALITGSLLSAVVAIIWHELSGFPMFRIWVILTLATTSAAWILLLGETRRLLWGIERATGLDLNGDGIRGNPRRVLEVELKTGNNTLFVGSDWLEINDEALLRFASQVVRRGRLAEGEWAKDRATFPHGINQYRKFRARLNDAGLIRPVNATNLNSGYELTPAGRAVFGKLAEHAHTRTHTNDPAIAPDRALG
jgi:hypothetical protein